MTATSPAGGPCLATIVLKDAGKEYIKYEDSPMLVTRALRWRARTRRSRLWAVRHIGLTVGAGESVGVIGRNGSGKSTLLRMLAGVTAPTEGSVKLRGRVAPLISVGVGFHPELTGRENVYVNGTVLGLDRADIDERLDAIVDFAEIGDFIDTPVKFYSSGMFVRLGFAVAVTAEPDVLLVDEVLAVGDLAFQLKCYERMREIKERGSTIVVVSHNLHAVRQVCPRTIVLHDGQLRHDGDTDEAISLYHQLLTEGHEPSAPGGPPSGAPGEMAAELGKLELIGPAGLPTAKVDSDDEVVFSVEVKTALALEHLIFSFSLATATGIPVYSDSTPWTGMSAVDAGTPRLDVRLRLALPTGSYTAAVSLQSTNLASERAVMSPPLAFYVAGRRRVTGVADLHADFSVVPDEVRRR